MFKYNSKFIDSKTLSRKKKLLHSIFNVNYNSKETEDVQENDNSYMTKKSRSNSLFGNPSRASNVYNAAQASLNNNSRSNSSLVNLQKKVKQSKYLPSFLELYFRDYSQEYSSNKANQLKIFSSLPGKLDTSPLRGIKAVQYNLRDDRTINIKKRLSQK